VLAGGYISARLRRQSRSEAAEDILRGALAAFMQACELVAFEIADIPAPTWFERQIDRLPRGRFYFFGNRLLARLVFGNRHHSVRSQYFRASADLVLVAPVNIISLALQCDDFFVKWQNAPSREMEIEWTTLREQVRLEAQRAVDRGLGRPYRAGEEPIGALAGKKWWQRRGSRRSQKAAVKIEAGAAENPEDAGDR
jgi:hypothetical protein